MRANIFLSAFMLVWFMAASVLAEDYVVDSFTTESNGGGANPAPIGTGDRLTITRKGWVTTIDKFAHAIAADNGAEISNYGTLSTSGEDAYGMRGDTGNHFVNSGAIATSGLWAAGIYGIAENNVVNTGTIATTGINATGMRLANDNLVVNSGSIYTEGPGGNGVYAWGSGNEIVNSGTIATTGADGRGIYGGGNSSITNTGTIVTNGAYAYGIAVISGGSVITHSGKIISDQSIALYLSGTDNTLNLQAPAMIGGTIRALDPTTVNILTGPSHSVHWTFDPEFEFPSAGPAVTGPVSWSFNAAEKSFATFDATALSAADVFLEDLSHSFHGLALDRFGAPAADAGGSGAPEADAQPVNMWLAGLGGSGRHDGSGATLPYSSEHIGLAAGVDRDFGDFTLGAMVGTARGRFSAESVYLDAQKVEVKGGFAGIYGRHDLGRVNIDLALAGGWLDFRHARAINDNLAPSGLSTVNSEYRGWWTSPAITVSLPVEFNADWVLTPRLSARYVAGWIEAYSEQGAYSDAANAIVDSRLAALGEVRFGLKADRSFVLPGGTLQVGLHAGVFGRKNLGNDTTAIWLNGTGLEAANPSLDIEAGFLSATARIDISSHARISIMAEAASGSDGYRRTAGRVKFTAQF